jgi:hypothetical protein
MSIKGKVTAAAAVMTLVGGVSAIGTLTAQAATPSCYEHCIDLFSQKFAQSFVLDVQQGQAGQPIRLYQASNGDAGEDFFLSRSGRVSTFVTDGLVSSAVAARYGGGCSRVSSVTHDCVAHYANDWAYQLEYAPDGVPSDLCVGLSATVGDGTKVALEPCVSSSTAWVADAHAGLGNAAVPLVNGSDTSTSDPYVLNYPGGAAPFLMPTPQLTTWQLQRYPSGRVFNNQLWSAAFGQVGF